jgi:hypothetical protein
MDVEANENWREWTNAIPFLSFPTVWRVQVIPPFGGAMVRFRVTRATNPVNAVSIYLDVYNTLGSYDGPYWEVCPYKGNVGRCSMHDTEKLIEMIKVGLREPRNSTKQKEGPK